MKVIALFTLLVTGVSAFGTRTCVNVRLLSQVFKCPLTLSLSPFLCRQSIRKLQYFSMYSVDWIESQYLCWQYQRMLLR